MPAQSDLQRTPLQRVTPRELASAIDRVRTAAGDRKLSSNYFFTKPRATEIPVASADRTLLFLDREHDFQRLYFLSYDLDELARVAGAIPDRPIVCDVVTQGEDPQAVDQALEAAGFKKAAVYQRMTNRDLAAKRPAQSKVDRAQPHEADLIYDQLCQHFDVRLDRIPTRAEFAELVRNGQVLVHRDKGEIGGYIVYQLQGRRAHSNYWYIRPGTHPAVAFKLLSDLFTDLIAKGVSSAFMWVERGNAGVAAVHQRLGFDFDGLATHVYVKE